MSQTLSERSDGRRMFAPSYVIHWIVLFSLIAVAIVYHRAIERVNFRNLHIIRTAPTQESDWYLVLRMPEIPSSVTDVEGARKIFIERIEALRREGFHPILLSDVHRHMQKNVGLPSKPVVLLFDPGHRHTYDVLAPVLKQLKVPAVWMTDGDALRNSDRRYISRHEAQLMVDSGLWDVSQASEAGEIQILNAEEGRWTIAKERSDLWAVSAGIFAFNSGTNLASLNRLNVNSTWSADEFTNRVGAEVPIQGTMKLTARPIRNHQWGLAYPQTMNVDTRFTIESTLEKRGNTIAWLGTQGLNNAEMRLTLENLTGEFWLLCRSDEDTGESVRVGFDQGMVLLDQETNHHLERLTGAGAASSPRPGRPLNATIRLKGSSLQVYVDDHRVLSVRSLKPTQSKTAVLRLTVYDKLRGTAYGDVSSLTFRPLSDTKSENQEGS